MKTTSVEKGGGFLHREHSSGRAYRQGFLNVTTAKNGDVETNLRLDCTYAPYSCGQLLMVSYIRFAVALGIRLMAEADEVVRVGGKVAGQRWWHVAAVVLNFQGKQGTPA